MHNVRHVANAWFAARLPESYLTVHSASLCLHNTKHPLTVINSRVMITCVQSRSGAFLEVERESSSHILRYMHVAGTYGVATCICTS